jgi:hypothetical protein
MADTYRPAAQLRHAIVEAVEKLPAGQGVQVAPPLAESVSVTEPAEHTSQSTVGLAEYFPASQDLHKIDPATAKEPTSQEVQLDSPVLLNVPDSH